MSLKRIGAALAAIAIGTIVPQALRAADAVIALRAETSSIDPHFALVGANQAIAQHIFDPLVDSDENQRPAPGLAESWRLVEPTLWEFRLRAGVTFHDGSPLTAADVKFSLERMPNVPNSPAPFVRLAGTVTEIIVADERTIRLRTRSYDPSVPLHAMGAYVVSARAAANATTADFNAGRAAIGSGPYRFVEWTPGQRLVLRRNERWWGPAPAFETVTIRPISGDASRLAALLAGDVQMIDAVPPSEIERLRANPNVAVWTAPSSRMIYLGLEQESDAVAAITDNAGQPLARNPLKDVRVRRAISLAINRAAIVERLLLGAGQAAGQMVPAGMVGHDPEIAPLMEGGAYDQVESEAIYGCTAPFLPLASRADVLVFESEPLAEAVEVTGPVTVRLWIASDGPDTDFTAKLIDVYPPSADYPRGYAMNITDGILRARYRASWAQPTPLEPGRVYEIAIEPFATSNLFARGHRIRLDISSSNFPHFDVNPNTGEPEGLGRRKRIARNSVFVDASRPSHVVLPVIVRR